MVAAVSKNAVKELRNREKNYVATLRASDRLEELGAGNYYLHRLRNSQLLPVGEWEVLRFIFRNFPLNSHIVEIGCGWGQLLAMAAAVGYSCAGVDYSLPRLEGAKFLRRLIDADFPGAARRLRFVSGEFPSNWDSALARCDGTTEGSVVGFFSNLGLNRSEEFCDACVAELGRFDYVLMDVHRFFSDRMDLDVQNAFIRKMDASGILFHSDIAYRAGAYRFISLMAKGAPMLPSLKDGESRSDVPLIDLGATSIISVRSKADNIQSEKVLRIVEDNTPNNSHDIRLQRAGRIERGLYRLKASFRARERRGVCIFLHNRWRDQVGLIIDVGNAQGKVERVLGDSFKIGSLRCEASSQWAYVDVEVEIATQLEGVEISVHLLNEYSKYSYDGDGKSSLDVQALTLSRI